MTAVKATETMRSDARTLVIGTKKGRNGPFTMVSTATLMPTVVLLLVSGMLIVVRVNLRMFTIPSTMLGVRETTLSMTKSMLNVTTTTLYLFNRKPAALSRNPEADRHDSLITTDGHSLRKADSGSIRDARIEGSRQASIAIPRNRMATPP